MAHLTISYEGIKIRAIVEREADIRWLAEFLVPCIEISDDVSDGEIRITQDSARIEQLISYGRSDSMVNAFMIDAKVISFPVWNEPEEQNVSYDEEHRLFYLLKDKHVELIVSDSSINVRTQVMRVLRELAMGVAQIIGGTLLHASAFVANGRAAITTGPRQAGKTSLLSYLLSNSSGQFLANDRLLMRQHGTSIWLQGMPTKAPTAVNKNDGRLGYQDC